MKALIYMLYLLTLYLCVLFLPAHARTFHYKQVAPDTHTQFIYTLKCYGTSDDKCSLQVLVVSDDKAKNSCYVVYQTLFKKQHLVKSDGDIYSIQVNRSQCGDSVTYTFGPKTMTTAFTAPAATLTPREQCNLFKAAQTQGSFLSRDATLPQIGFGECRTLSFKMDE